MPNFLNNNYDIYNTHPSLYSLPKELEDLAEQIYRKGLLRISTGAEYNFVLFPMQNGEKFLSFSLREVTQKKLIRNTKNIIRKHLLPSEKQNESKIVNYKLGLIRNEAEKYLPIKKEQEMAIARIIVQSAEPVIIQNLINENIYFFISFRQSISDLLSVKNWEASRFSQGLQTNCIQEASIFASCGGNPFFDPTESNCDYDGIKAIDRLNVILAQEIGHYADIIKDDKGRNIDRFSCELNLQKPKEKTEKFRQKDLANAEIIKANLLECGLKRVFDLERKVELQAKFRKKSLSYLILYYKMKLSQLTFVEKCNKANLPFIKKLYKNHKEIGKLTMLLCGDMIFNLNPASSAYRNNNKDAETAIYCAEALARVPQQKVKWGEEITKYFIPNLYNIYYKVVIKEQRRYYLLITGNRFQSKNKKRNLKLPLWKEILNLN